MPDSKDQFTIQESPKDHNNVVESAKVPSLVHEVTSQETPSQNDEDVPESRVEAVREEKKGFFSYFRTKEFYIVLVLG